MLKSNFVKLLAIFFLMGIVVSCKKNKETVATLTIKVIDAQEQAVENAKIKINEKELVSDKAGVATIDLDKGSYAYVVSSEGFIDASGTVEMVGEKKEIEVKISASLISGEIKLDASDLLKWHYFSFEKGEVIGVGSADPEHEDDKKWMENADWDVAFHYNNVRTNSGLSGNAKGGGFKSEITVMEDLTEVPANAEFKVDTTGNIMAVSPFKHGFFKSTVNPEINRWASYGHGPVPTWNVKENVYLVRTADEKFAKMKLISFEGEDENPLGGKLVIKYVYQSNGSDKF